MENNKISEPLLPLGRSSSHHIDSQEGLNLFANCVRELSN